MISWYIGSGFTRLTMKTTIKTTIVSTRVVDVMKTTITTTTITTIANAMQRSREGLYQLHEERRVHDMLPVIETDDGLRAIMCNCSEYLNGVQDWKSTSLSQIRYLWLTGCDSSMPCIWKLEKEMKKEARESKDIWRPRQMLWEKQDE
eukprot:1473317-Karenia_brevis.AAC.1